LYHKNDALDVSIGSKLIENLTTLDLLYTNSKYTGKYSSQNLVEIPDRIKVLLEKKKQFIVHQLSCL